MEDTAKPRAATLRLRRLGIDTYDDAQSPGELAYALDYAGAKPEIIVVEPH